MKNELKNTMNRFVDFINTADEKLAAELVSQEAIFLAPTNPEPLKGPDGYMAILQMMRSGFPDIQWHADDILVDGDKVAVRYTMNGTHKGDFFGISATQKAIEIKAMNFYRFNDGKIIEEFGMPDLLGLLLQLGGKIGE